MVMSNTQLLLNLLCRLGWRVNVTKSMLDPSQDFVYIGVRFLTAKAVMVPPDDRIDKIHAAMQQLISGSVPARQFLSALGLLGSAEKQVPLGRIHIRPLQVCLRTQFNMGVHSLDLPVSVPRDSQEVRQAISWWMDRKNLTAGQSLGPYIADVTIYTDASKTNWGAHDQSNSIQVSGPWSPQELSLSINQLELLAVIRTLELAPPSWRGQRLLIATDNSSVVAYINNQGGTRSMQMLDLASELFRLVQQLQVTIRARHIPGRLNRVADLLSRAGQIVNTEWTLSAGVATLLWSTWCRPNIDLMATHLNHRLPTYVSPFPHESAYAVDAMSLSWAGMEAYVFPPWPLVQSVLSKLRQEPNCLLILVVPRWPNRPWFPLLLDQLCDLPRQLPQRPDLLSMPLSGRQHGALEMLDLHACRVCSNPRPAMDFHRRCQREWHKDTNGNLLSASTSLGGKLSLFGAVNGISIPAKPL